MSKVKTEIGWVYVVIVLGSYSKKIVGKQVGLSSKTGDRLAALEQGLPQPILKESIGKSLNLRLIMDANQRQHGL